MGINNLLKVLVLQELQKPTKTAVSATATANTIIIFE
jgi:hypothetical protein